MRTLTSIAGQKHKETMVSASKRHASNRSSDDNQEPKNKKRKGASPKSHALIEDNSTSAVQYDGDSQSTGTEAELAVARKGLLKSWAQEGIDLAIREAQAESQGYYLIPP